MARKNVVKVALSAAASRPLRVKAARPVHHALGGGK